MVFVRRPYSRRMCSIWQTRIARGLGRSPSCSNGSVNTDPRPWRLLWQKAPPPVPSAPDPEGAPVSSILRHHQCPRREQPPVHWRDPRLNDLVTDPLSLLTYDAFILPPEKDSHDTSGTETRTTETAGDEPATGKDPDGSGQ